MAHPHFIELAADLDTDHRALPCPVDRLIAQPDAGDVPSIFGEVDVASAAPGREHGAGVSLLPTTVFKAEVEIAAADAFQRVESLAIDSRELA